MKTDIVHGLISSYNVRGCRCAECKDTRRRYSQIFRDRQKAKRLRARADALKSPLQLLKETWQQSTPSSRSGSTISTVARIS